jgi:hypothetical protein
MSTGNVFAGQLTGREKIFNCHLERTKPGLNCTQIAPGLTTAPRKSRHCRVKIRSRLFPLGVLDWPELSTADRQLWPFSLNCRGFLASVSLGVFWQFAPRLHQSGEVAPGLHQQKRASLSASPREKNGWLWLLHPITLNAGRARPTASSTFAWRVIW